MIIAKQFEFFDCHGQVYPAVPGHKTTGTSAEAAQAMQPHAETLRDQALAIIKGKPSTADEVAAALHKSVLAIRPRLTELKALRLIVETGVRRPNASGLPANEMRAV